MAVPKSRLHCCSLRKLMPGASSLAPRQRGSCRFSVRKHLDFADTMLVAEPLGLEHNDELALTRLCGLHVHAEDSWTRRRIHPEYFRLASATLQAHFDVSLRERLEGVESREVNRKTRRADQRQEVDTRQRAPSCPSIESRSAARVPLVRPLAEPDRPQPAATTSDQRGSSTDISGPQCVSHGAFQGDLCQARLKP